MHLENSPWAVHGEFFFLCFFCLANFFSAEISYYFLNHPNRSCLPSKSAKTLFQNAVFREGEIERFQTLVRKMKGVRRIEVDYEEVLKDKENLRPVYKFLGLEPPPAGADKTVKMHPTDIPWYDYIGRKDPVTGEITCPWRKGRGKVQSGGSSGVQMAG